MFDVGFWELLVIAIIGLLVLGPERLPVVARKIGRYIGKARRSWNNIRTEIEAEIHSEEMKKVVTEPVEQLKSEAARIEKSARDMVDSGINDTTADSSESDDYTRSDSDTDKGSAGTPS